MARVVSSATYALDPLVMGLAPAWALPLALQRAGLRPEQIDIWEVHEAFSAQALGVLRELRNNSTDSLSLTTSCPPMVARSPSGIPLEQPGAAT